MLRTIPLWLAGGGGVRPPYGPAARAGMGRQALPREERDGHEAVAAGPEHPPLEQRWGTGGRPLWAGPSPAFAVHWGVDCIWELGRLSCVHNKSRLWGSRPSLGGQEAINETLTTDELNINGTEHQQKGKKVGTTEARRKEPEPPKVSNQPNESHPSWWEEGGYPRPSAPHSVSVDWGGGRVRSGGLAAPEGLQPAALRRKCHGPSTSTTTRLWARQRQGKASLRDPPLSMCF